MNDLIAREIVNGTWFVLSALMVIAFGVYIMKAIKERAGWYDDRGTQAAIALLCFTIGGSLRSGWIWLLLSCENDNGVCSAVRDAYWIMFVASAFAIVGGVCSIRIFTPEHWRPWSWLGAGVLAVAVPIIVHLI